MRTTVTINDKVFRALKQRALYSNVSLSALVEDAVMHQVLEDAKDIEDALKRESEPSRSFHDLVREFEAEGLL